MISPVTEARRESLRWISAVENPGSPFSTMKPAKPGFPSPRSSVRAQTTATSATGALVIHIFVPLRIQSASSPARARTARVRMFAGSEPASGSVSPKQPRVVPAAMPGR